MKTRFQLLILAASIFGSAVSIMAGPPPTDKELAQLVADGNNFIAHGQRVEALWAYRQAAKAGNIEGAFAAGDMLLNSARNSHGRERILKASEGMQFIFFAATNHHVRACVKLSEALRNGIGNQTNLIAAYAWMKFAGQLDRNLNPDLDQLVVLLEPGEVRQAQAQAHEFQLGHWPNDVAPPVALGDPRLMVQGITIGARGPLVVINNTTLAVGDTVEVRPANMLKRATSERLIITCREAGADYVLIAVADELELKLLSTEEISRY